MSLPLSHYYIFTGHNSYLTGNQLNSKSSADAIIKALQRGIRAVELDLWPGSHGRIEVFHGRTLTSAVKFEVCLNAIKQNAFIKSQYPVIITLEDHLPEELQAKAAKIIKEVFGSHLYKPPLSHDQKAFPSPEELKNKIIISTKPPWKDSDEDSDNVDSPLTDEVGCNTSKEYMDIIAIRQGRKCKSLSDALRVEEHAKRVSLSEQKFSKIASSDPLSVVKFTKDNILRIYPRGSRIDSSNYDPMKAFLLGAQMVALNTQGHGKRLWVAQGFFKANGGCSYVKKPEFVVSGESASLFSLYNSKNSNLEVKQTLKVKVCMGCGWYEELGKHSFDKSSPPDLSAKVEIAGVGADKEVKRTAMKKDEWEPIWNEEFEFKLRAPELAILRIKVNEHNKTKNVFAGQAYLPVSELKPGYRVVNLCDKKGREWKKVKVLFRFSLSCLSSSGEVIGCRPLKPSQSGRMARLLSCLTCHFWKPSISSNAEG